MPGLRPRPPSKFKPQVMAIVILLGIIGMGLVIDEMITGGGLSERGWAALGSVITALGMLATRLLETDK